MTRKFGTILMFVMCLTPVAGPKRLCPTYAEARISFRQMRYRPGTREEALRWQEELREKLFGILKLRKLVDEKKSIPLDPKILKTEHRPGYRYQVVEIRSTPGRRIRLVCTIPEKGKPPFPGIVCIHGHGGNREIVYDPGTIYKGFASELARRGAVTVSTDVGQHKVHESGHLLMGERLWDVIRCVDYLESLPEADRSRLGCAGLSLGGEMAMWLGAMDPRIRATVSSGFLTVMDQMEKNHCMCWKFEGLRELVDYADIYSLTAPRALMCQNGEKEGPTQFYVPIARQAFREILPVYRDFDAEDNLELVVHPGGHEIDLPSLLRFFEKHLGLADRSE